MKNLDTICDPTRNEMLIYLGETFEGFRLAFLCEEIYEFAVEAALYWFASDYHAGQASNLYALLSTSPYHPSILARSVADESATCQDYYQALVEQYVQPSTQLRN